MGDSVLACWCGNEVVPISLEQYSACPDCGTLILTPETPKRPNFVQRVLRYERVAQCLRRLIRSRRTRLRHVAIDMTPLLVGGENGGARLVPLVIVPYLSTLAPKVRFTLLTSERNHDSLASLRRSNVGRYLVSRADVPPDPVDVVVDDDAAARFLQRVGEFLGLLAEESPQVGLPPPPPGGGTRAGGLLAELRPDLLVCPFTAPFYFDPVVPVVSVVYDLQYLSYPQFFTAEERSIRARTFSAACQLTDRLICISEYVRSTVLGNSTLKPDRGVTVHLGVLQKLHAQPAEKIAELLTRLGVGANRFLVFPANFWPHKNHRMLLTALGMFRSRYPESDLQLVCTGTPDQHMESVRSAADAMGLGRTVVFAGYVSDDELAALYQSCSALVFPSLYEGFGMPVLEAMAFDKPVLCSNVTSLPEIAGDAALLFDPRKPDEIADAIQRIESEPTLRAALVKRGRKRVARFGHGPHIARAYLRIFQELMNNERRIFTDALYGMYTDGWVGPRLVASYAATQQPRTFELLLRAPRWLPGDELIVNLHDSGSGRSEQQILPCGERVLLRKELTTSGGVIEVQIGPVASPISLGLNDDTRELACECELARLVGPTGSVDLRELTQGWLSIP